MEDDQNERRPKWKANKMEDDQIESDQNGRRPKQVDEATQQFFIQNLWSTLTQNNQKQDKG